MKKYQIYKKSQKHKRAKNMKRAKNIKRAKNMKSQNEVETMKKSQDQTRPKTKKTFLFFPSHKLSWQRPWEGHVSP